MLKLFYFLRKVIFLSLPFIFGLFLVLFAQIPFSVFPYYHQSFPFILVIIFYFAVFNPVVLNVFFVFLLGLIADSLSALPLGFNAVIYVFVYFIGNFFRPYLFGMFFHQLWIVFSLLLLCSDIIWAFLFFVVSDIWVSAPFWFVQYLFTALSYPIFSYICGFLNKKIKEVI